MGLRGSDVHETMLTSSWDNLLLGIPFIALLFIGFFRLDQVFAAKSHSSSSAHRAFSGMGEDGELIVRDPDGRTAR